MKVPNIIPKSSLTFTIPIVLLIAVFFIGYYFYYIPKNKNELEKNGFLILQNIKDNILERNNDYQNLYKNYFNKSAKTVQDLQQLLDRNHAEGTVNLFHDTLGNNNKVDSLPGFPGYNSGPKFRATDFKQSDIIYLFRNNQYANGFLLPAESVLSPVFQSQKAELFESYLLADKKNGIIYKDPSLGIVANISLDSLLPNSNAIYASVRKIKMEDIDYILFSYPFKFGNDDVILCGFVNSSEYNAHLHEIPVAFIYPIVIAFLLLLIFLPILKFYLMGKDETIKFIDIILSVLSFIVGPALTTLILIQVLLLWSADIRAKVNLEKISSQIDSGFTNDILSAYDQMDVLDSLVTDSLKRSYKDSIPFKMKEPPNLDVSQEIFQYYKTHKGDPDLDYKFDRVFWIDSVGLQKIKGQVETETPLFTNVATRKYFKIFKDNNAYLLPGHADSFFGFEPINSWVDGDFKIIISKKSRFKNGVVVAIAMQMPSVTQTILPPGFGFCIIDDSGKVQLHSDMNRNLQENIIEKITPSRPIKEAISSRQASYFNGMKFYGKTNAVNIIPISKIPFSLITFYDKGYIVPVNMRIFTFALLFCILSFFIYFFIWIVFFRKRYYVNPMLYSPMDFLKWAIPKKESSEFYVLSIRLLIGYIAVLLLFMAVSGMVGISNYVVLVLVVLTPVNVIAGLFVISYITLLRNFSDSQKLKQARKKAKGAIIVHVCCSVIVYTYSLLFAYPIEYQFLIFQGLLNIAMWLLYLVPHRKIFFPSNPERYLSQYSGLATALILCLTVLPAGLYTWYAHNQEITQAVKKGQLYLAESLEKRSNSIIKFIKNRDSLGVPDNYYQKLQYKSGIYSIYNDSFNLKNDSLPLGVKGSYEQFYFGIANDIGNNYYDPLLLPALKDTASDKAWYWSRLGTKLYFRYALPDKLSAHTANVSSNSLIIISTFPDRYKFVGITFRSLLLILVVVLLIRGLYVLVGSLAEKIFLKKYLETGESERYIENKIALLVEEFNSANKKPYPEFDSDVRKLTSEYEYYTPADKDKVIYKQEKDMIDTVQKLKPFYDFIWQKCTEKEQYLLLDFAKDSLVNFKNIEPIYGLLEKGILIKRDNEIKLFSASFRSYVLGKKDLPEIYEMKKKFQQNSTWQAFRTPVLLILLGIALFIFFTQEETFQKITAIVAGVTSVGSMLLKFFVDGSSTASGKK